MLDIVEVPLNISFESIMSLCLTPFSADHPSTPTVTGGLLGGRKLVIYWICWNKYVTFHQVHH